MSTPIQKIYVLDTNVLLDFALWIPIAYNSSFWSKLAEHLKNGDWVLLDVVVGEIKQHHKDLISWCKQQEKLGLVKKITAVHKQRAVEINDQYKIIDDVTQKSTTDTFLIAYAEANSLAIFSRETPRKTNAELYKIPDVCTLLKIDTIRQPATFLKTISFQN